MPSYRSKTSTAGRNMAGARALWRATGMHDADFDKPIIAVANSFTQFVPGHVHLKDMGLLVAREIELMGAKVGDCTFQRFDWWAGFLAHRSVHLLDTFSIAWRNQRISCGMDLRANGF